MRFWALLLIGWLGITSAQADEPRIVQVQLKDGTRLEGEWRGEEGGNVLIEIRIAGGTIRQTREIPKADIAELTDLGEAELAQRNMELAYANLQRFQLNPTTSYAAEYYDEIIARVLRPFLEKYPHSPHAEEVAGLLSAWQAERQQLAEGRVRFRGQWLPLAAVNKILGEEALQKTRQQAETMLQQARTAIAQRRYQAAAEPLRLVATMTQHPELAAQALAEQKTFFPAWLTALEEEQPALNARIQKAESQSESLRRAPAKSQSLPKQIQDRAKSTDTIRMGQENGNQGQSLENAQERAAAVAAQQQLPELRSRLATVQKLIPQVLTRCEELNVAPGQVASADSSATTAKAPDTRPADMAGYKRYEPPLANELTEFFRNYWMHILGAGALAIWLIGRKLNQ